jgi:hypothetical protein
VVGAGQGFIGGIAARAGVQAVRHRTERGPFVVQHPAFITSGPHPMNNAKHGNKEAKKPKKVIVPNAPGLPASLAPLAANPMKPKKR